MFNFKIAKRQIRKHTQKIFEEERSVIISSIGEEYDKKFREMKDDLNNRFTLIQATSSRLFAISIEIKEKGSGYANKLAWWFSALENCIETQDDLYIGICAEEIKKLSIILSENGEFKNTFISECQDQIRRNLTYTYNHFNEIIKKIPDSLITEKEVIKSFYDSIKDELQSDKNK